MMTCTTCTSVIAIGICLFRSTCKHRKCGCVVSKSRLATSGLRLNQTDQRSLW